MKTITKFSNVIGYYLPEINTKRTVSASYPSVCVSNFNFVLINCPVLRVVILMIGDRNSASRSFHFVNQSYDYELNWTSLSPFHPYHAALFSKRKIFDISA